MSPKGKITGKWSLRTACADGALVETKGAIGSYSIPGPPRWESKRQQRNLKTRVPKHTMLPALPPNRELPFLHEPELGHTLTHRIPSRHPPKKDFPVLHERTGFNSPSGLPIQKGQFPICTTKALRRFCAHARFQPHRTAIKPNSVTDWESGPLHVELLYTGLVSLRYLVHNPAFRSGLRQWMYCPNPNCSGVTYEYE